MSPPTFAHGTITDVVQNLHSIATELRRLQAAWLTLPRTYFSEVQAKLNVACAAELVAIDEELRKDTALLAWRARNIFEYFLLFVRVDDEHYAKAFAGQLFTDKIDILKGVIALSDMNDTRADPAKREISRLTGVLVQHEVTPEKYWSVAKMAEYAGAKKEYDALFKLFSKYVHPSGFSILAPEDERDNFWYQEVMIQWIQKLAHGCLSTAKQRLAMVAEHT